MLDRSFIGRALPPLFIETEAGRMKFFAESIGETDPIFSDEAAAKDAGHPSIVCAPTFLFCLNLEAIGEPAPYFGEMGADIRKLLHAEQSFIFHGLTFARQSYRCENRVANIYEKKNGALEFLECGARIYSDRDALVLEMTMLTVLKHD